METTKTDVDAPLEHSSHTNVDVPIDSTNTGDNSSRSSVAIFVVASSAVITFILLILTLNFSVLDLSTPLLDSDDQKNILYLVTIASAMLLSYLLICLLVFKCTCLKACTLKRTSRANNHTKTRPSHGCTNLAFEGDTSSLNNPTNTLSMLVHSASIDDTTKLSVSDLPLMSTPLSVDTTEVSIDPVDDAYFTNDSIDSVDRSDSTNGFVPGSPSATRYEVKVLLRDQSEGTCVRSIGISKPPNSGSSWNKNSSLYTTGMNSNSGRNARTTPTDTDKSEDAITVVSGIGISSGFECIKVRAIIDTGADVSLIDESIVRQSKARILKLTSTSDIRQVEGKPLELLGKCVMALFLHGKMYQHTFLIPRTPSVIRQYQVLIGNDLLSKIGELSINYTKGLLILRDSKIASTFIFKLRGDSNRRVCIEEPNPTNWTYGQSATSSMSKPDDSSRHTKSSSFVLSQASEKSGTPSSTYLSSMSDVLSDTKGISDSQISSPTKLSSDGNTSIVSGNVGRFSQNPSAARATSTPIRSTKLSFASSPRSVNTEPPSGSRRNFHTKTFPNGNATTILLRMHLRSHQGSFKDVKLH